MPDRDRDREIAAAIVAGDPSGLAAAYNRYAAALYAYCRALLGEPADAADAVKDTFVIVVAKLPQLQDPDSTRPWLYAVARNECHRRLRERAQAELPNAGDVPSAGELPSAGDVPGSAVDMPGGVADVTVRADRFEARDLADAALASLSPAERDVAELSLRHHLDDASLAAALGVSRGQARMLASRARRQFESSLGALLARVGPEACPELGAIIAGGDGGMTAALRKRVSAHISRCALCGERELQPVMQPGPMPAPALLDDAWQQVRRRSGDATTGGAADRARIVQRAEPFGKAGFPVPLDPPTVARTPRRPVLTGVIGAALLAVLGAGTIIVTDPLHRGASPHGPGSVRRLPANTPSQAPQAPAFAGRTPTPTPQATAPAATPVRATKAPVPRTARAPIAPLPTQASPTPATAAGTLTVWPTTVNLRRPRKGGPPSGSFTLTAHDGPIATFAVVVPPAHVGDLTVTPASGSLAAGQSAEVRVTLRKGYHGPLHTELSVQPGGLAVAVVYRPLRH